MDDVPDLPVAASNAAPGKKTSVAQFDLTAMPVNELLSLRAQIEARLPAKDLKDMDMARELVLQVLVLQQMQQVVLDDGDTPANQKAQVANSLSAALINLVRLQTDVYTSERLKQIEQALEETINGLDEPVRTLFMDRYGTALGVL
jgi:hypothetical protein